MRASSSPERILTLIACGIALFLFVWFQWKLLLLAFAGLLLSIVLHSIAHWVARRTRLAPVPAYMAVIFLMAIIAVLFCLFVGPRIITQIEEAAAALPNALMDAESYLRSTAWGPSVLNVLRRAMQGSGTHLSSMATSIVKGAVDLVVVAVIGFFGALHPRRYREGLLSLVPEHHRQKARKLSNDIVSTLRYWLLGQLVPMTVLGVASMITLWVLGVPLAFTLGLLTGLMIFMPYVGSILSGLAAIVVASQRSWHTALYVFFAYCVFHLLEGYILTPLVQRRAVRLPPVMTILAQFCLWSFGGILGVAVAAPLAAVVLVTVRDFYVDPKSMEGPASVAEFGRSQA